ncbi:MAG: ATP-binding protein [Halioglobus sp.]|nr:ATP-binding protein [Halioglobus sp.]
MKLRGSLFAKLFMAFWLVTIIILGSWQLTSNYFESQPPGPRFSDRDPATAPNRFMLRTLYNLENLNLAALTKNLAKIRRVHDIQIYLLTRDGSDLLGREVPQSIAEISRELRAVPRKSLPRKSKNGLSAIPIYRQDAGALTAVFKFPQHRRLIVNTLSTSLWLRISLAVLISGVICFSLSRLMTGRLKDLQLASRRLATGDLGTRLQVRDRGGDETDELARDFNTMAKQLQERIETQKRLLGDVSHELRSPLARLRVALALAQEKPDQRFEYLQRIEQETERLEDLISQLLSSQMQDVTLDVRIDLVTLLRQLCADANFEAQGTGKYFTFNTDTERADVDSFEDLLHKSFDNILRNALQHTTKNSEVKVSITSIHDGYLVMVDDQGQGVPENELNRIFSEFYRLDSARSRESGGHGLGLTIAKRALLQHGGKVTANNTDTGLRISVRLPSPGKSVP